MLSLDEGCPCTRARTCTDPNGAKTSWACLEYSIYLALRGTHVHVRPAGPEALCGGVRRGPRSAPGARRYGGAPRLASPGAVPRPHLGA